MVTLADFFSVRPAGSASAKTCRAKDSQTHSPNCKSSWFRYDGSRRENTDASRQKKLFETIVQVSQIEVHYKAETQVEKTQVHPWGKGRELGFTRSEIMYRTVVRPRRSIDSNLAVGNNENKLQLHSGKYELALAIQDRSFNEDGSLYYPASRAYFDGFAGPCAPVSDIAPIWNPEFFGDTMLVNGIGPL